MSGNGRQTGFKRWIEAQAKQLRTKAVVGPFERLDPHRLAEAMGIHVASLAVFGCVPAELIESVAGEHGTCWDAGTLELPDKRILVVYNPTRDVRRRTATLMEELAHVHLGHKRSKLLEIAGVGLRTWHKATETQAYAVGTAALLPEYLLKGARTRGYTTEIVADQHEVSNDLVIYRQKVTGIHLPTDHRIENQRTLTRSIVDWVLRGSPALANQRLPQRRVNECCKSLILQQFGLGPNCFRHW